MPAHKVFVLVALMSTDHNCAKLEASRSLLHLMHFHSHNIIMHIFLILLHVVFLRFLDQKKNKISKDGVLLLVQHALIA